MDYFRYCGSCRHLVPGEYHHCSQCGQPTQLTDYIGCNHCQNYFRYQKGMIFCPFCQGELLSVASGIPTP